MSGIRKQMKKLVSVWEENKEYITDLNTYTASLKIHSKRASTKRKIKS